MTQAPPLRIAVVHSYYSTRQPSGENVVVDLQLAALRRAGHDVRLVARYTDELEVARSYPLRAGYRAATGRGDSPLDEINDFRPDVVHLHNTFPNMARRWIGRVSAPVVATLHNYRPICPAATLVRDGATCTLCPDAGSARFAVVHACFKESRAQTLPVALGTRFADDPVLRHAKRLVALNDDMRATYAHYGVAPEKLTTVPNFVDAQAADAAHDRDFWVFVGRLSHVKGIIELLRQWPADQKLVVVGTGPQEDEAKALAGPGVTFAGQLPHEEVTALLGAARGLVFPSLWPEGLPTVYLEALAAGLPVLAWPQSIVGTLVREEGTGFVTSGDLAADLERARQEFPGLVAQCRATFAERYSEDAWVTAMTSLYREAIAAP